jgi:co-chaperonin GroES (HSP10)
MPHVPMQHDTDPKTDLIKEVGDISGFELYQNQILCAVYIRPEKTKSGIIYTTQTREEDRHQSKVGLVLKTGPDAFVDESGVWFKDVKVHLSDWIVFRPSDGWSITVNGVLCRILKDETVRGRVSHPDLVY